MNNYRVMIAVAGMLAAGSLSAQPAPYGPMGGYGPDMGYAHPPMHSPRHRQAMRQQVGPAARLKEGLDKLLGYLAKQENLQKDRLMAFLDRDIAPFFDFDYMAKVAGGGMYRQLSDAQRSRMSNRIKQDFLTTMARRLSAYNQQQLRLAGQRLSDDGRTATARVMVSGAGGYPSRLDFRMYRDGDDWRVYDVSANGQSAVAYFRNEFRQHMGYGGGPGRYPAPNVYR